ncbi:MAG TPA: acyl-CoA dehydrogenase family protein, partial [Burkholderiales bacterium]|nr:acyl-CoA dehydrogenase family protein [Burkholderiales bacterium]
VSLHRRPLAGHVASAAMPFNQPAPQLGNQYAGDRVLRSHLKRALPAPMLADIEKELLDLGELAGGELYRMQIADRLNEPVHTPWDAWGNRHDDIEVSPLWKKAQRLAAEKGLVALAYERRNGRHSRIHQFALVHLFTPATDLYSCPLAMTDGAARALVVSGNRGIIERALPHLTSRDPAQFWTSGQWMTESTGGSDVGLTETAARREGSQWRLYGRKWFTSAATSQMALTLARPEGNPPGGKGLALFYVETRDAQGRLDRILVQRLKDKLGTRKVPTAELMLEGTPASLVAGEVDGVRNIAPMLNVTRTWNGVSAVAYMRRGIALARDYAGKRTAFGAPLARKPLHVDTLAGLQAEYEAGFQLAFFAVEMLGRDEAGDLDDAGRDLLRLVTPIAKLVTGKQSVAVLSEILESFGGAGYVEDTGLPALLRDAQVFPIWEGTTNVLSLDVLRTLQSGAAVSALQVEVETLVSGVRDLRLLECAKSAQAALLRAQAWIAKAAGVDAEAGARRFAMTLGRALALLLLCRQAQWSLDHERDERAVFAAQRFARNGADMIAFEDDRASSALANDQMP